MTSHFKIILRQLAFCEMSQGVLARVVDSPLTWTFPGNNIEQIEPFSHLLRTLNGIPGLS